MLIFLKQKVCKNIFLNVPVYHYGIFMHKLTNLRITVHLNFSQHLQITLVKVNILIRKRKKCGKKLQDFRSLIINET